MPDRTGDVFQNIHEIALKDSTFVERATRRYSVEEFGFSLEGMDCCVFGCGAGGTEIRNLLDLGARRVWAIDLIPDYVPTTEAALKNYKGRFTLDVGSLATHPGKPWSLPYREEQFDFITCNGVLHHIEGDQAEALNRMARTVKPGGRAYFEVKGKGGIWDEIVNGVLRDNYAKQPMFRQAIDNLSVDSIRSFLAWARDNMKDDATEQHKQAVLLLDTLAGLIDVDFVQCVLDRLQAPIYEGYTEAQFSELLKAAGFASWQRIRRYPPMYKNVRKIAAPFYANDTHPFSRILYGDGQLSMLCLK